MTDFEPTNELRWVEQREYERGPYDPVIIVRVLQQRWCKAVMEVLPDGQSYFVEYDYEYRDVPTIKQES